MAFVRTSFQKRLPLLVTCPDIVPLINRNTISLAVLKKVANGNRPSFHNDSLFAIYQYPIGTLSVRSRFSNLTVLLWTKI